MYPALKYPVLAGLKRLILRRLMFWGPFFLVVAIYFALGPEGNAVVLVVPALLLGGLSLLNHSYDQHRNAAAVRRLLAGIPPRNGQWTAVYGTARALEPQSAAGNRGILAFDHRAYDTERTFGQVGGRNRDLTIVLFVARYLAPTGIKTDQGMVRLMAFPDMFEMELSDLPADIAQSVESSAAWAPRFPPRSVLIEGLLGRRTDRLAAYLRYEEKFKPGMGERKSRVLRDGDRVCVFGVWRNGELGRSLRLPRGLPVFAEPPDELCEELGDVSKGLVILAGSLLAAALALAIWLLV